VQNAKAFLKVQDDFGSFDAYIWQFVGGSQIVNSRRSSKQVPARTPESDAMSKDLKKRGILLRRHHDLLRFHAGHLHGERPPDHLLPAFATVAPKTPAGLNSYSQITWPNRHLARRNHSSSARRP
jgi:hypothetical protein